MEKMGFEPTTFWMPFKRSPKLSYFPIILMLPAGVEPTSRTSFGAQCFPFKIRKRISGASSGTWTHKIQVLNLPRMPIPSPRHIMVDLTWLEHATLCLQGRCSPKTELQAHMKCRWEGLPFPPWAASSLGGLPTHNCYLCTDGQLLHPLFK